MAWNSPLMWTTSTGSVSSTQTMRISPSPSSSTPSRSIRRVVTGAMVPVEVGGSGRSGAPSGGRGPVARGRGRDPLRLEGLAQAIPRILERDAGDDRLQEPEDDELARLVGRDPAALEVEQLRFVDRANGRAVHGAPAVRLVDLEARDRDRAGRLRQVHPELAEVAVRPDRGLFDRDQALHVGPGLV